MDEKERAIEFVDSLVESEGIITENIRGLNQGCPLEIARDKALGLEKNCKLIKIDTKEFSQNPYIKNIYIGDWQVGNVYLNNSNVYKARRTFTNGARTRDKKTLTSKYEFAYFDKDLHYPSLGNIIPFTKWMGVEPGEVNTFMSFIKEAKGNVLLMGCGLAYVAYMLSLKNDVDEITIIEFDPDVVTLFLRFLKPQMNNKIKIIQGDAMHVLEHGDLSKYQYCSVDIWHGTVDMLPIYLRCLLFEQKHPNTKFHYWLEEDLHISLENVWMNLIKDFINDELPDDYPKVFKDILKMQNIKTVEDIRNFIIASKKPIIKKWAMQNQQEAYNNEGFGKILVKVINDFSIQL